MTTRRDWLHSDGWKLSTRMAVMSLLRTTHTLVPSMRRV